MSQVTYKIAAKTDVGLVRTNNEDNLFVISNLDEASSSWVGDVECQLGKRGALLVVADGMGGMNAGEVASDIAITVIKDCFLNGLNDGILSSEKSIVNFMNDSILKADRQIKTEGRRHRESRGMGTTIVIAWLYNGLLYVSWCGDSRAYIYNPALGIRQISKDHSYVQELVDKGVLSKEDAFDFPESNVITRCLSHSSTKAEPDNLDEPIVLTPGDTILLCTDGLSGMIRDTAITEIMSRHKGSMNDCADALIDAAKVASGADNITVALCQILSVDNVLPRTSTEIIKDDKADTGKNLDDTKIEKPKMERQLTSFNKDEKKKRIPTWISTVLFFILFLAIIGVIIWFHDSKHPDKSWFFGNGNMGDTSEMVSTTAETTQDDVVQVEESMDSIVNTEKQTKPKEKKKTSTQEAASGANTAISQPKTEATTTDAAAPDATNNKTENLKSTDGSSSN